MRRRGARFGGQHAMRGATAGDGLRSGRQRAHAAPAGIERIRHRTADRFGLADSIPMVAAVTFVSRGVVALMMRERH
jgi:hypothetical protein